MAARKSTAKVENPTTDAPVEAAASKPRAAQKLNWQFPQGFENRFTTGQFAQLNGNHYAFWPVEGATAGKFTGTWTAWWYDEVTGEAVCLMEAGKSPYSKCVDHHNKNYRAPAVVEPAATEAAS